MIRDGDPEAGVLLLFAIALLAIEKLITVYHAHHYVNELLPAGTTDPSGNLAPR